MANGEPSLETSAADSFREFRNNNLFNPWGLSPELTEKQFKAIQDIDKTLAKFSWYQGLSVFGSTMFGYGTDAGLGDDGNQSDIDIFPMLDSTVSAFSYHVVYKHLRRVEQEATNRWGIPINFQHPVDLAHMHDADPGSAIQASQINMYALEALSNWTTQNGSERHPGKVSVWRTRYRTLCDSLKPTVREILKRNLVDRHRDRDLARESKIEQRIAGYKSATDAQKRATSIARRKLWNDRVQKLFGL